MIAGTLHTYYMNPLAVRMGSLECTAGLLHDRSHCSNFSHSCWLAGSCLGIPAGAPRL